MKSELLLDNVAETGAGPIFKLPFRVNGVDKLVSQIDMSGAIANVEIQGRLHSGMPWVAIFPAIMSADDLTEHHWVTEIRANVASYTSGNITARVGFD